MKAGIPPGSSARTFVGSRGRAYLSEYDPLWPDCIAADDQILPEILDGYHVRAVIARELKLPLNDVPGKTYATGDLSASDVPERSDDRGAT